MNEQRPSQTECLVTGKKNKAAILKTVLGLLSAVFFMILAFNRESLLIAAVGAGCGAFAYISYVTVFREYEYTLGEGTLSVDVIYSKKRRRPLVVWDLANICLMAPESSEALTSWQKQSSAFHDFSSVAKDAAHYCSVCKKGGRVTVSRLSPEEGFLIALQEALPRGVIQTVQNGKPADNA